MQIWNDARHRWLIPLLAIVAIFAFAACGDDEGDGDVVPTDSPVATEEPTNAEGPTEAPSGDAQSSHDVDISGFAFSPGEFTVPAGEVAVFNVTNNDGVAHNMHVAPNVSPAGDTTAGEYTESRCEGEGDPCTDPGTLEGGESGLLEWQVPNEAGTVQFRCDFHPTSMIGVITIQ